MNKQLIERGSDQGNLGLLQVGQTRLPFTRLMDVR